MRANSQILGTRNKFGGCGVKGEIMANQQLPEELHKP